MSITLTDHQNAAVKKVVAWFKKAQTEEEPKPCYLGGYAGSGKTAILPFIVEACGLTTTEVFVVTPTGKAARVAGKKLRDAGVDIIPSTIHSAIYRPKALKAEVLEYKIADLGKALSSAAEFSAPDVFFEGKKYNLKDAQRTLKLLNEDLDKAYISTDGPTWHLNTEGSIREASLIIVDEASMVGEMIRDDLKSFGIPILAIGDPGQLQPVKDNPGFCIGTPDVFLTEIHRQAKDNPIIALATHIREGGELEVGTWGETVDIVRKRDDEDTLDMDKEVQVLCGTNATRWKLTKKIRKAAGYDLVGPMAGEPLIVRKNSRVAKELVNGMFLTNNKDYELVEGRATFYMNATDEDGVVRNITVCQALFEEHYGRQAGYFTGDKKEVFEAKKKQHHVDWGHCITTHLSQGSQWSHVVVHDEGYVFRDDIDKWRYTAVTRAADKLTVVI
jgi:exodeoxyribonuclease-5